MNIKQKITTMSVLALTLTTVSLSYLGYSRLVDSSEQLYRQSLIDNANGISQSVTDYIRSVENTLKMAAQTYPEHGTMLQRQAHFQHLKDTLNSNQAFIGLMDGSVTDQNGLIAGLDANIREWFNCGRTQRKLCISKPYKPMSSDGSETKINIAWSYPVVRDGAVIGVIGSNANLEELSNKVSTLVKSDALYANLTREDQILLASTDESQIGKSETEFFPSGILSNHQPRGELNEYQYQDDSWLSYTQDLGLLGMKARLSVASSEVQAMASEALWYFICVSLLVGLLSTLVVWFVLKGLLKGLDNLSKAVYEISQGEGDLTARLAVNNNNDEVTCIAVSFNRFVNNLQEMMRQVSNTTEQISENLDLITTQSQEDYKALESHARETEMVVSAISEMNATAESVSQSAEQAANSTQATNMDSAQAKTKVQQSSDAVQSLAREIDVTSARLTEMNTSTEQIQDILQTIEDIASQTNLLALNAAIEAARAGEYGRGFSVVADEVRSLAVRTQTSTEEIGDMLGKIRAASDLAVESMDNTKTCCQQAVENSEQVEQGLSNMAQSVEQIDFLNTEIAAAANQQSFVSGEVHKNMTSIQNVVHVLTENGQKTRSNTTNLTQVNESLCSLVNRFKIA